MHFIFAGTDVQSVHNEISRLNTENARLLQLINPQAAWTSDVQTLHEEICRLRIENAHLHELTTSQSHKTNMTVKNINDSKITGFLKFNTGFCFITF